MIPNLGEAASPEAIVHVAQRAEELEYESLWLAERVLYPLDPQTPYPGTTGGLLPDVYRRAFTPLETLSFVAAHTRRIALGTSVLVMPYHNPVLVARQLATVDVLSGGRLRVGLGQGWSKDEYDATGAELPLKAARGDEFIAVLRAMWGEDPVDFQGEFFKVPRSIIQPKPVQQPAPPIYLAAYTPRALQRVAELSDGWIPTGVPLAGVKHMMGQVRQMAEAAGRDPSAIELIVLAHVTLTDQPQGSTRAEWVGSLEEIRADIEATRELGTAELILSPGFSPAVQTEEAFLQALEQLRNIG
jgi:probable F420-dependent oxidoreductase